MFGMMRGAVKNRETKFEILGRIEGRWLIECIVETGGEEQAIGQARVVLAGEKYEEVKIIRQTIRKDGFTTEAEIFKELRKPKQKKDITAAAAADADYICRDLDDFYGLESRIVIGRVLREYLDKNVITPTELLHHHSHLSKLHSYGNLLNTAVSQVAGVQARSTNVNVRERIDALYVLVNKATTRARDIAADRKRQPVLEGDGLAALARRVEARFEPADRRFAVHVGLAGHLMGSRSFGQMLEKVMALATADADAGIIAMLDNVIADILGSGQAVKDLLGHQPDLGSALRTLSDLGQARIPVDAPGLTETLAALNRLIVGKGLPACRAVIADRLCRAVKSNQPLSRADANIETRMFQDLQTRLKQDDGETFGGQRMVEALAARQKSMRTALLRQIGIDH